MQGEYFALPDGSVVSFNPGGRWHGWLWRRHPDGQLVSVAKLTEISPEPLPGSPAAQTWALLAGKLKENADGR